MDRKTPSAYYRHHLSRDPVNGVPWYGWVKRLDKGDYTTHEVHNITGLSHSRITQYARRFNIKKFGINYVWTKDDVIKLCERRLKQPLDEEK